MSKQSDIFLRDGDSAWEPAGEGVRRKILTYNGELMMVRVAFEKGAIGPVHSHPHLQSTLVESGVWDVTIAGRTERLRAGDSFLVTSGAERGVVNIEAGQLLDSYAPMREDFI